MKTAKIRMTVITRDNGDIVGTSMSAAGREPSRGGLSARIVAGPGQRTQEIEVDVDEKILDDRDIAALHALVRRHLDGREKPPRKTK